MIEYRILGGEMRRGYWEIGNVMKITGYELVFFLVFFFMIRHLQYELV